MSERVNGTSKKRKWIVRYDGSAPSGAPGAKERIAGSVGLLCPGINPVCARIIYDRCGGNPETVARFIRRDYGEGRSPFGLKDMDRAVERLERAIENRETCAIFGDYDVDGVTSVSVLYLYLRSRGMRVGYFIPTRADGYGMTREAIDVLAARGVSLIVTVDTGITANEEISYAASVGIDTVVTDHHECRPELPEAVAVVNPHRPDDTYPFKELAGVGVAYKLVAAMETERASARGADPEAAAEAVLGEYCDLIAIGTVADVMPIVDENRMITHRGIEKLRNDRRRGISALIEASQRGGNAREITASFISFTLAPRLNAAGRMGNAGRSVELLLAEDDLAAREMAVKLCEINRMRQIEENRIVEEAVEKLNSDLSYYDDRVIVLADDSWQQGVIGIVASRISEREGKPTALITFEGMPTPGIASPMDVGKGSGRSVKGMNLVAALASCEDILIRYGGHEQAAGLSVTRGNLPELRRRINEYAAEQFSSADPTVTLEADTELCAADITVGLAADINRYLEPCSSGNPQPVFILRDAVVQSVRQFSGGKHTKISVVSEGRRFTAIFYGRSESEVDFDPGDSVDLLFTLNINNYAGETTVQLILSDICYSRAVYRRRLAERARVRDILRGGSFTASELFLPDRDDFVSLYGIINDMIKGGRDAFSDRYIMRIIRSRLSGDKYINYVKYKLLLAIFAELDIFKIRQDCCVPDAESSEWCLPEDFVSVEKVYHNRKINLESSDILGRIRRQCDDGNFSRSAGTD
ncbi:MAG: single-stranded-DNA-specific exonuclease RecJ [Clostridia bacterium]|nr:single-stranded-DNA-specific exonuclease RecJ [Clostridia bacterium]